MPLSGLLSVSSGGWPSIFYVFGAIGTVWCVAFLYFIHEDPESHTKMDPEERKYIQDSLGSKIGLPVRRKIGAIIQVQLSLLKFPDSTHSLEVNSEVHAILGHTAGAYGS